jgi:(p)ppGpp synthase/HD superfamily hydrolase
MRHPTSLLERALALAVEVHDGHRDADDRPYVLHPLRVMARVNTDTERIVALLHDTVEKGDDRMSFERLRAEGFPAAIVVAVDCLTRREGEDDEEHLQRITPNALASKVKLADIADHLDLFHRATLVDDDLATLPRRLQHWRQLRALIDDQMIDET